MYWLFYIVLPLIAALKKRSGDVLAEFLALYGTMAGVFLAVWCESIVCGSLSFLLPKGSKFAPWCSGAAMVIICVAVMVLFHGLAEKIVPDDKRGFIFPSRIVRILVPVAVFFRISLLCAFAFSVLSVTPAGNYLPFVFKDASLCSSARYRILWNSFLIDRFSFQDVTVNQRRRAFDRFVPEQPGNISHKNVSMPEKQKGK